MQTRLGADFAELPMAQEAQAIVRQCVHCGFCTATCPTYQLLGDELDGPRGRIYLIKQMLEGEAPGALVRQHLDRCLSCRACESTCPSGVHYARLADIGRQLANAQLPARPLAQRAKRWLIAEGVSRPAWFRRAYRAGQALLPVLPKALAAKLATPTPAGDWPPPRHARKWLLLGGCAQPALAPNINAAAARVFDRIGISLLSVADDGCCGALRYHLDDVAGAERDALALHAKWQPLLEGGGFEGVISSASACTGFIREYAQHFAKPGALAGLARQVSDVAELALREAAALREAFAGRGGGRRLALQAPCTLQHGLQVRGVLESLLADCGFVLSTPADAHLCCGSAGAYSLLQPALAQALRDNKLKALQHTAVEGIASANIGCISHLGAASRVPVRHWLEWLDEVAGALP